MHRSLHHAVVVASSCVCVRVKLPLHTKFPNKLLWMVDALVKPEPVVELDDCVDGGNYCHDEERQFQISHKFLT
jgi:hypothetical protein